MNDLTLTPIGVLRSPFREKFGIPRQPGLAPHALARLVLEAPYARPECLEGITGFSHLWLVFIFHGTAAQGWSPTVRPPRLGGNKRVGVFATRSMFRPNPIGLSLVELVKVIDGPQGKELLLRGADLLDGTPVVDIKPYVPYTEARPEAQSGYAPEPPPQLPVNWSEAADQQAKALGVDTHLRALIGEVLAQDPRPAYAGEHHDAAREYGVWLDFVNVRFQVRDQAVLVIGLEERRD